MENIIGHEREKNILQKIIEEDKVGHAYLFTGKEGIGKKLVAKAFAKQIMSREDSEYNDADLKIVLPENDLIKVETIRNLLNDIYLKPVYSKQKVVIIDDAEKMNANAQNALLKMLEEPPLYATLILITSNKEKILKTILSRVTEITFEGLSNNELSAIVGDTTNLDYAQGSASKAIAIHEGIFFPYAKELAETIANKDYLQLNRKMTAIKQANTDIIQVLEMTKIIFYKGIKENTYEKIRSIELLDTTIRNINRNANVDLALDKLMIELCRE